MAPRRIDGDTAFKLHDTFGFPLDLTADVCRERGVTVDEAGFNAAMNRQREQARAAGQVQDGRRPGVQRRRHRLPRLRAPGVRAQQGDRALRRRHRRAQRQGRRRRGDRARPHARSTPKAAARSATPASCATPPRRVLVEDTVKVQAAVHGHQGRIVEGR
jgi:alanyl-tRNA synthetase